MKKALIFDLDGTLVDSIPGIAEGLGKALLSLGYPVIPQEAVRFMVGKGAWNLCKKAWIYLGEEPCEEKIHELESAFTLAYQNTWQKGTSFYPGVAALLEELSQRDLRLAILTNKPHVVTEAIISGFFKGDSSPFDLVLGASPRFPRKPDTSALRFILEEWGLLAEEALFIGDSRVDAQTAQQIGMDCALVSWGYEDEFELICQQFQPHVLDKAEQVLDFIEPKN